MWTREGFFFSSFLLLQDAEKLASNSDKISIASSLGRSTDVARIKPSIGELKEKVDKAKVRPSLVLLFEF